jgi:hypothetical protein
MATISDLKPNERGLVFDLVEQAGRLEKLLAHEVLS